MDPMLLVIMGFFLVAIILTGGFVLLIPLSRQLAKFMDMRMQEKIGGTGTSATEIREMRALVEGLEKEIRAVADRQEFLEKVLEARNDTPKLPHG